MNDKQFEKMEEIQAKRTNSSERTNIPSDEEYSVPIRNKRLLRKPELCIEDTVFAPENIGIKSMRPVQTGHMPSNLAPFTLLLEVSVFTSSLDGILISAPRGYWIYFGYWGCAAQKGIVFHDFLKIWVFIF